ncbi:winged helix-turn-helix domain-containing protein [Methanoregula sp.]|jgi:DNA-binding MarR family transcriptional regulator|uniref:winged helix-turn-helix domain-containing protein n=1 Tax=Methanoregula sp. TaxID=2052170 RepID=UPI0025FCC617|nr:winged helix-turn-helix domain-containing protein [Methanoregula sp.]
MYNLVSFVARGSVRRKVLKGLIRPNSPTELAKSLGIARSAVSRTIQALEKVGLVECLTPDEKMSRYYRTTDIGRKVVDVIEENGKI